MQRKMETKEAQKIYKLRSKTAELPFANLKQNMKLTEFTTTGLKQVNTEFKLYAIGHNLKRIYNEINRKTTKKKNKKQTKFSKNKNQLKNFASIPLFLIVIFFLK